MGVENDERDNHKERMPVKLDRWVGLPGESTAEMQHPHEYLDDNETAQSGCGSVLHRHPAQFRRLCNGVHDPDSDKILSAAT